MLNKRALNLLGRKLLLFLVAFTYLTAGVSAQASVYKALETPFYDPNSSGSSSDSCGGDTTSGGGLPSDILSAINKNKSVYEQASQATKVPWELLAGVHYRETGLSTSGSNLFQISGYSGPS